MKNIQDMPSRTIMTFPLKKNNHLTYSDKNRRLICIHPSIKLNQFRGRHQKKKDKSFGKTIIHESMCVCVCLEQHKCLFQMI